MRKVRISSIAFSGRGNHNENRKALLSLIERALLNNGRFDSGLLNLKN